MNFISYYVSGISRSTFEFKFSQAVWSPPNLSPEIWPIFKVGASYENSQWEPTGFH